MVLTASCAMSSSFTTPSPYGRGCDPQAYPRRRRQLNRAVSRARTAACTVRELPREHRRDRTSAAGSGRARTRRRSCDRRSRLFSPTNGQRPPRSAERRPSRARPRAPGFGRIAASHHLRQQPRISRRLRRRLARSRSRAAGRGAPRRRRAAAARASERASSAGRARAARDSARARRAIVTGRARRGGAGLRRRPRCPTAAAPSWSGLSRHERDLARRRDVTKNPPCSRIPEVARQGRVRAIAPPRAIGGRRSPRRDRGARPRDRHSRRGTRLRRGAVGPDRAAAALRLQVVEHEAPRRARALDVRAARRGRRRRARRPRS